MDPERDLVERVRSPMRCRERFQRAMHYGQADRVPYFEEGIRAEVVEVWRRQGLSSEEELREMFPSDPWEEVAPDLDPQPPLPSWPKSRRDLVELEARLDPWDPKRLGPRWLQRARALAPQDTVRLLRVHRGFFLSMGVDGWDRLTEVMYALKKEPQLVRETLDLQAALSRRVAERVLEQVDCDAVVFSEPIGGNDGPLISPKMYKDIVLASYRPLLEFFRHHGVDMFILRTYANARLLIPSLLEAGFNCLWACEVNIDAMDYRDLRRAFGRDLRLIGGIDLDALRRGKEAIRRELEEKLPPLLAEGGYIPMADGRVREDVRFEDYVYYRRLLREIVEGCGR